MFHCSGRKQFPVNNIEFDVSVHCGQSIANYDLTLSTVVSVLEVILILYIDLKYQIIALNRKLQSRIMKQYTEKQHEKPNV